MSSESGIVFSLELGEGLNSEGRVLARKRLIKIIGTMVSPLEKEEN